MIEEGVHTFHGFGGILVARSKTDIDASLEVLEQIAKKWSKIGDRHENMESDFVRLWSDGM